MSKTKKIVEARYLFVSLFLLVAAIVIGLYFNRSMVIGEISVHGYEMADPGAIIAQSGLSEGMHGDSIVYLDVIERIEQMPWVSSAHLSLSQSGKMRIRVEEEEPIALLVDEGRSAWVTSSGIQLPVVLGKPVDVPILYGFKVADRPDTLRHDNFQKAQSFLATAARYPGLYAMISEVMVTKEEGLVALADHNAVRLTFGHRNFDERLRNWKTFQSKVISEKGMEQMRSLDFRFRGQVVAMESQ